MHDFDSPSKLIAALSDPAGGVPEAVELIAMAGS
jgi:hypothetical protein